MNRKKTSYTLLLLIFGGLSILIADPYRQFVYENSLKFTWLADVGYNIFAVTLMALLSFANIINPTKSKQLDVIFHFVFYAMIEILSFFIPILGTFDINDLAALFMGFVLSFLIFFIVENKVE